MFISLTIIRYRNALIPVALLAMAIHRLPLFLNRKCRFWKLLGCGRDGSFSIRPDFNQWALLCTWDTREDAEQFLKHSFISNWWKTLSREQYTILCESLSSHGKWDNINPFEKARATEITGPVAVLTRATIRPSRLKNFWKNVPEVSAVMHRAPGLITSFGIGEAPLYRQATFSVWENTETLTNFAYRSPGHAAVIKRTRDESWYSEELFARFKPLSTFGSINGTDPLKGKI